MGRWHAAKKQHPALSQLEADDDPMNLDEENVLKKIAGIYQESKGFRNMLATKLLFAMVQQAMNPHTTTDKETLQFCTSMAIRAPSFLKKTFLPVVEPLATSRVWRMKKN